MHLNFEFDKVRIDPTCHIQLARHAEQFQYKNNIYGQLYGAFLDDTAQVTSILPLPDGQKTTKEELQAMEKRNDDLLDNFNLDAQKIGWYLICYTRNFWDSLETVKYYENYINLSFFLVYDYKARLEGRNPYKAYRLKEDFAVKDSFKWSELQNCNITTNNPFQQIPVEVQKNELFQLMMLFHRKDFLKDFEKQRKPQSTYGNIRKNVEQYITAFEEREDIQKYFNETYLKGVDTPSTSQKMIPFNDYSQFIGQALKLDNYQQHFKGYLTDNKRYEELFQAQHQ